MRIILGTAICVLLLTACSTSGGGPANGPSCGAACLGALASGASTASASPTVDMTYSDPAEARADACAFFSRFYEDLMKLTPHGSQVQLLADFGDAHRGIVQAAISSGDRALLEDVTDLVGHVGSSDWPADGTPIDPEIIKVQDDCS